MKKLFWTTAAMTALILGANVTVSAHPDHDDDDYERDNGPTISETYDYDGFDAIGVSGVYDVDIEVGKAYSISLSGPEREMENVEVTVERGELKLGNKKKWRQGNRKGIDAIITLPALDELHVSGVASGDVTGVDSESFDLHVSGVAEVNLEGTCGDFEAHVSGVGELDAEDLECKNAEVHLSGVGEMSIYASDYADISAGGVGEVNVYGDPKKVDKNKSLFTQVNIK